jgi:hypothetical protein
MASPRALSRLRRDLTRFSFPSLRSRTANGRDIHSIGKAARFLPAVVGEVVALAAAEVVGSKRQIQKAVSLDLPNDV